MYLYNRCKQCSGKLVDDAFHIHSLFIDDHHEMILDLVIGMKDAVIRDINFIMLRAPRDICKDMQSKAKDMKGIAISQGISKIAKEKLGGSVGCYHLLDLFLEGAKAYRHTRSRLIYHNNDPKEIELKKEQMKGSCYYYSQATNK